MRSTFLITAILFCLATAAAATDRKKDALLQAQSTEQTQMPHYEADGSCSAQRAQTTEAVQEEPAESARFFAPRALIARGVVGGGLRYFVFGDASPRGHSGP